MLKAQRSSLLFSAAVQIMLATTLFVTTADAAPRCSLRTLITRSAESVTTANFSVSEIVSVRGIRLKAATVTKIQALLATAGKPTTERTLKKLIETAASIHAPADGKPSIESASKMAELGRKILKEAKPDLTDPQYKAAQFMVGEAVMKMESIQLSEYKNSRSQMPVFRKKSTLHIDKFHDLTESYIDGTAFYRDLPQDGGFLSWPEIRGLYTNNSWAIGIRHHDMYHLHYSYAHPYYLAVNMHSSRTINDRRYSMISTLWEAVDTFRTGYESELADYYRGKNMSVEEGMLDLATASNSDLDRIERKVGKYQDEMNNLDELAYSQGWRPSKTRFGRDRIVTDSQIYHDEIRDYINESIRRMARPGSSKYGNYHRLGPGNTSSTDQNRIP